MMRMEPLGDIHLFPCRWEFKPEGCAAAYRALHADPPGVLADDPVADGKAQSRTPAGRFGCEERIEDLIQVVGGNAHSVVGNLDEHRAVLGFGSESQLTAARHSVPRVHDQVHE